MLEWTTTPPTEPGIYWARLDDAIEIVKVTLNYKGKLVVERIMDEEDWDLGIVDNWLGPIEVPVFVADQDAFS